MLVKVPDKQPLRFDHFRAKNKGLCRCTWKSIPRTSPSNVRFAPIVRSTTRRTCGGTCAYTQARSPFPVRFVAKASSAMIAWSNMWILTRRSNPYRSWHDSKWILVSHFLNRYTTLKSTKSFLLKCVMVVELKSHICQNTWWAKAGLNLSNCHTRSDLTSSKVKTRVNKNYGSAVYHNSIQWWKLNQIFCHPRFSCFLYCSRNSSLWYFALSYGKVLSDPFGPLNEVETNNLLNLIFHKKLNTK